MRGIIVIVVLFTCTTSLSKADTRDEIMSNIQLNDNDDPNGNMTVVEQWENFEKMIKQVANTVVKKALPSVMEYTANLNLSTECMRNAMHLTNGLKNIRPWAMRCK